MACSLPPAQLDLLQRATPSGVSAADDAESQALCTLARLGLLSRHAAGIYVLTGAGRRYLAIEAPQPPPPPAG